VSGAAVKIAKAIKIMNEKKLADVIIVARGGGSLEDLWPFNEEIVARAIYESDLPVISAVGHETDFTIADFVSDLRAPTPSAAAELAVADTEDLKYTLTLYNRRLKMALKRKTEVMRLRYEKCMNSNCFKEPLQKINERYLLIDKYLKSLENSEIKRLKDCKLEMVKNISKLDVLSPLKTLTRGYSITTLKSTNKVIKDADDVKSGDEIEVRVNKRNIRCYCKIDSFKAL
jgi:exodeoxyribonuclease VII large subunit